MISRATLLGWACAIALIANAGSAWAQARESAQPRQLEDLLRSNPVAPRPWNGVDLPAAPPSQALAEDGGPTFFVKSVRVEGATIFPREVLRQAVAPIEGRTVTLAEAHAAADAITLLYRNAGFILSRAFIPAQEVEDGVLRIDVVEGAVGEVRAEPTDILPEILGEAGREIHQLGPFRVQPLERSLLRLNLYPGLTVRALIQPATQGLGRADIVLLPERDPVEARFLLDNSGSDATGPWRAFSLLSLNGWAGGGERTKFILGGSVPDFGELWTVGLQHEQHLAPGTHLSFSYTQAHSKPGGFLADLDLRTSTRAFSIGAERAFIQGRGKALTVTVDLEHIASTVELLDERISKDRLWLGSVSVGLDFFDPAGGANSFALQAEKELGGRHAEDTSRFGASVSGFNLTATAVRQQSVGPGKTLYLGAQGQWSAQQQISSQETDFGGNAFGRGFAASAITGETGLGGTVELRQVVACKFLPGTPTCEPYVFADAATVLDRSPDGSLRSTIGAVGAGGRLQFRQFAVEAGFAAGLFSNPNGIQTQRLYVRVTGSL